MRRSLSLKSNPITFPSESQTTIKLSSLLKQKRNANVSTRQTSRLLQNKQQRQTYIQSFEEFSRNNHISLTKSLATSQAIMRKGSLTHRANTSNMNHRPPNISQESIRRKTQKSARTQQAQKPSRNHSPSTKALRQQKTPIQIKNKLTFSHENFTNNNFKNSFDLQLTNSYRHKDEEDALICKSIKKPIHVEFYNNRIASFLFNKKIVNPNYTQNTQNNLEVSFNAIMERLKCKNRSQILEKEDKNKKYDQTVQKIEKTWGLKEQKSLMMMSDSHLYGQIRVMTKKCCSKELFRSAVDWSNKRTLLMNVKTSSRYRQQSPTKKQQLEQKYRKEDFAIQGWVK